MRRAKQTAIRKKTKVYYVINIKLMSNTRKGATAYQEVVETAYEKKEPVRVRGEHFAIIRQLFHDDQGKYLHGSFCRFTHIDDKAWINLKSLEFEDQAIPKDKFPNPVEIDFYFFPELHRFAIPKTTSVSIGNVCKIINDVLTNCVDAEEKVEAFIEQSDDIIQKIIDASVIRSLYIEVAPTNGDNTEDAEAFIDEELHIAGASKVKADFKSERNGTLSLDGKLLRGLLGVAKSYGFARARIINDERPEDVDTSKHPRAFPVTYGPDDDIPIMLDSMLKGLFRGKGSRIK